MADEVTTAAAPAAEPTVTESAPATTEPTEKPTETNGDAHEAKDDADETQVEPEGDDAADTPAGKDKKRKSVGGVPEHKSKKLNKKKSMPNLHLDCQPGEFYWARLKGYPPWPAIICDEDMLPESLLASRPVSTARPDGSLRDDFKEGGKNAKERTFPIMFLYTNEFQWMVNTALTPLEPKECETLPKSKMTKALQNAYKVAAEGHDIEHFKKILTNWQEEEEMIRKAEEEAAIEADRINAEKAAQAELEAEEEAAAPKPKKKSRKSKAADDDIEMEDAEVPKSSKKRKKEAESDAEKPKKTPKVTKLNAPKTPNGESSAKKSATKTKKKVVTAPKVEEEDESKPQLTEEEKLAQREKAVLYLRHRLQKGFLSRDQAPQESEMAGMAEFFTQLEQYHDLEASIIRSTKIHKVLKAIVKLASVPKDDEFNFKKRSSALLEVWNKRMEADADGVPDRTNDPAITKAMADAKARTNGENAEKTSSETPAPAPAVETKDEPEVKDAAPAVAEAEKSTEPEAPAPAEAKEDKPAEDAPDSAVAAPEPVEKTADLGNDATDEKDAADAGDVSMVTAPEDSTV